MPTSTRKLRVAIVPLVRVSLDTHTHGYLDTRHPKDRFGYAIPCPQALYFYAQDKGFRFFSARDVAEYVDVLGKLQEVVKAAAANIKMETVFQLVEMIDLVKIDDVLLESDFDFDNKTEYYDIPILNSTTEKTTEAEDYDNSSIKYWANLKDVTANDRISVYFKSGGNSTEYEVFFDPLPERTTIVRHYYNDYNNDPQYYDSTVVIPKVYYQLVAGGTYVMTNADLNVLETLKNSLPSLMNFQRSNDLYENKNSLQRSKTTFNFTTRLEDPLISPVTDLDTTVQFQTMYKNKRFGAVIYEQGKTIYKTVRGKKILDLTNIICYGICRLTDRDITSNKLEWSAYRYNLTSEPQFALKRKLSQQIPHPLCDVAGSPNFLTLGAHTVTNDATDKEDDFVFSIGAGRGVLLEASGAYISLDYDYFYMEFDVRNFSSTDGGVIAGIHLYAGATTAVYRALTFFGNGTYRTLIKIGDPFLLRPDPTNLGLMYFEPDTVGPTAAPITFSITNVTFGLAE